VSLTSAAFDASAPWLLSPEVSLRDESFGALAYHHGNRRLVLLKSRELAQIVSRLGEFESADQAIDAVVSPAQHARYARALASLMSSGIVRGR
jgi:putative mycofactocin binding protein MftB